MGISTNASQGRFDATLVIDEARINIANCDSIKNSGRELISRGARNIAVDVSAVTFIDSSGIGALVALRKAVGDKGSVTLVKPSDFVLRVIDLTKMGSVFEIQK